MLKDLGKKLKETGENALDKTKKAAEIATLNVKINKREKDLDESILALGKKFYSDAQGTVPKGYEGEFAAIEEVKKDIQEMNEKIADLKEDEKSE